MSNDVGFKTRRSKRKRGRSATSLEHPESVELEEHRERAPAINYQMWAVIVGFLTLIVTVMYAFQSISNEVTELRSGVKDVGTRVERVERSVLARQFIITMPSDGASVGLTEMIRGKTPFPETNQYIVVTPVETGDDYVQDKPVNVHAGGSFTGVARFGTGDIGIGQKFTVRVLATKSALSPGPLTLLPEDTTPSEPITVTRTK